MLTTLDIQKDADRFVSDFYAREEPVLFRGAAFAKNSAEDMCRQLNERIAADDRKTERIMWYDVREKLLDDLCATPGVISRLMTEELAYLRENRVRIWFNPRGHVSPWHYDGHSLHVFNLQLTGRKKWTIVSPQTPLTCLPFNNTCLLNRYSLEGKRYFEFTLDAGDMIFLPRYWFHHVVSQEEMNINVNWVLMPKTRPAPSKAGRREAEMMWLKDTFYPVMPPKSRWLVDNYAGGGREAVRCITQHVSTGAGLARLAKETAMLPVLAVLAPAQLSKINTLRKSKHVMKQLLNGNTQAQPPAQATM